ncbi:MAG: dentilisin complex serine proteinase subunit PrtP [Treponema sp.]
MIKRLVKKIIIAIFFIGLVCSCKNQTKPEVKINVDVKINVLNARNSTKIVEGSTLSIYKVGENTPYLPPILLEGSTVLVNLERFKRYDFILSSTETLASSEIKNFYLRDGINEINIVQLDKKLPDRPAKAPSLTRIYAEIQGKNLELKDGISLTLPLKTKIYVHVFSYGGEITKLLRGGMSAKLGLEISPSSITHKDSLFLSGINPSDVKNIQKEDGWENIFEFELNTHSMGLKEKVDFIFLFYDVAGNRLEHHTEIRFNNMKEYKKYPKQDIKIKNVLCNIKTTYSDINLYSMSEEKQNIYYFPNFEFEVEGKFVVEIYGIELFRRNKTKNDDFIKVSEVLYEKEKLPPHLIVDTYGGLKLEEEYEYKIRALIKNHFYVESKIINVRLILPFNIELVSPTNNSKLDSLSKFTFKMSSREGNIKKLFSKQNADYFLFGLLIRSYRNELVFMNTFKYWLDDAHKGDEKLEIQTTNGEYDSLAKFKKGNVSLANKSISDFVQINEETGEITIKKDSLLHTNIVSTWNAYDKYTPYYWDICIYQPRDMKNPTATCCFGKDIQNEDVRIMLSSNVNPYIPTAYSSNGAFSFHLDNGDGSIGIIATSYIVKAPDDFSFEFLQNLNARVVDKIKVDEQKNETYYKIETSGEKDILHVLLARNGILSAEHDVAISLIEGMEENNLFPFSNEKDVKYYSSYMNDPLLKSSCYSLYITKAYQAYKEFDFGDNEVIAGIMDTGINENHEDFFISPHESIIRKMVGNEDIEDYKGHGTHCAGIIAGVGNNAKGIAGVAWKKTHLIPLKMSDNFNTYRSILEFVDYVKEKRKNYELEQKTVPFNMSFGSRIPTALSLEVISKALSEGVQPVVAMGNSGSHFVNYPAAYPGVIAVGSSNEKDEVSAFSDRGNHISLVAPGENIMSLGAKHRQHYYSNHGTSMAAPFVTGAIAYLMTFNYDLTPSQVKTILEASADKIEGEEEFNTKRGYGRINVYEARKLLETNNIPADKFFLGRLEVSVSPYRAGHIVSIYDSKNILVALGVTRSDGKVEFRGLLPASYTIKVKAIGNKIYSKNVKIPNDSNSDITESF